MAVDKSKKDTTPASRSALGRQMPDTSGVHPQVDEPPGSGGRHSGSDQRARTPDDEAHAEMERAVTRGDCAILSEGEIEGGMFRQQSGWFTPDQRLVLDAWYRGPRGDWARGASIAISADGAALLAEFLERRGR